jgi:hypothetical protein
LNDDILAPTPVENVARAQYYLAQVLFQTDPEDPEALQLDRSAKESLQQLLALDGSNAMSKYRSPPNYPILFDYIVPWETRLVTPRKEKVGLLLTERVEVVNRSRENGNEPELETATEGASPSALPA